MIYALEGESFDDFKPSDSKPRIELFKGSKVPDPPKQQKDDFKMPKPAPVIAAPVPKPPPPPPPPTMTAPAVDEASNNAKRQNARQNGLAKTLLAGETGGYRPGAPASGDKKTLLG